MENLISSSILLSLIFGLFGVGWKILKDCENGVLKKSDTSEARLKAEIFKLEVKVDSFVNERMRGIELEMSMVKVKVDTMWLFQLRRAESEAIAHGIAKKNSPLKFDPEVIKLVFPIKDKLHALYKDLGNKLSEPDLMLEIERRFGDILLDEVCIPRKLYHGCCLLIALEVAKEGRE